MIDGHCHLDKKIGNCTEATQSLYKAATAVGVENIVLLNLPELSFDNNLVIEHAKNYNGFFHVFPSVNPGNRSAYDELERYKASGASGLKLHPRLHGYRVDSDECIGLLRRAGELKMPVMVDCFPDGKNLSLGNTPEAFARLAEKVPDMRIAIGHAGGHKILDALMVAKSFPNIYLDLSYTLLYYRNNATVMNSVSYAIERLHTERVFWGSDYPDRPYEETVKLSLKEFSKMNLSGLVRKSILEGNIRLFLFGHK